LIAPYRLLSFHMLAIKTHNLQRITGVFLVLARSYQRNFYPDVCFRLTQKSHPLP